MGRAERIYMTEHELSQLMGWYLTGKVTMRELTAAVNESLEFLAESRNLVISAGT
jgi:hypothetical protein